MEEVTAHLVERVVVSVVPLARGRVIGLVVVTPAGRTPMAVPMAVLLVAADKVAVERLPEDQPGPHQDGQVLAVPKVRKDRLAVMIDGMAEVIAKRVDAGGIVEMVRVIRWAEASGRGRTAVQQRKITVEVTGPDAVGALGPDKVVTGEGLAVRCAPSGRNGRAKIAEKHAKSVKHGSHETKRNAGPLRCARVEAVPPV